jgi:hypothetical protein
MTLGNMRELGDERAWLLQTRQRGFDGSEPFGRNDIRIRRNRPVRKFVDGLVRFFHEGPTHECDLLWRLLDDTPGEDPINDPYCGPVCSNGFVAQRNEP